MSFQLEIETNPNREDVQFLDDRLTEFNFETTGIYDGIELAIFFRSETGEIRAGLYGWTWGGTCEIAFLWVHRELRGQGWGSRLLRAAEDEARARGCTQVVLDTHSFQAPAFYQKFGYEIEGMIADYPRGHQKFYLRKRLSLQKGDTD